MVIIHIFDKSYIHFFIEIIIYSSTIDRHVVRPKVDYCSKWVNGKDKMVNLPPLQREDDLPLGASPKAINTPIISY